MQIIAKEPVPFFVDNEAVISMVKSLSGTKLRRTIRIRHYHLQQAIADADVNVMHIATAREKRDTMTTALGRVAFLSSRQFLAMAVPSDFASAKSEGVWHSCGSRLWINHCRKILR